MSDTWQLIFDIVIGIVALYAAIINTYYFIWLRRRKREENADEQQ